MAVSPMHSTAAAPNKTYQDRAIAGTNVKVSNTPSTSQQAPSRPASTVANTKSADVDRSKTPLAPSEDLMRIRETDQASLSPDSLRSIATHPNMNFVPDGVLGLNPAMRGPPGANAAPGYMPPQPFFSPGMNLGVSQTGYGPSPQMQFYNGYSPNAYAQTATSTRPNSAVPKYPAGMDPKFSHAGPGQFAHSSPGPQMANNMSRRPSNYFVAPSMSPVQNAYGPRTGWVPSNATMITGPMGLQNGSASMQSPAMYQPALLANPNQPLMTPPGSVPQHPGFSPAFAAATVHNPPFPYPTPPETSAVQLPPDIPPAVPSIYPDPAYSNINACLYNPKGTTNVYIRGLRPETTDDDLLHMVRHYGSLVSTKAIIDTQTKSCKGFGFAKFESVDQGMACIVALSQAGYQCSFAKESFSNRLKELSEPNNTNLYISNLPPEVDEQRLDDLLKPHRVHSSRILRDSMRNSRGVGFARMTDRESADAVIEQWNGKTIPGSDTPLQVRFADTPMQKKLKNVTARRRSWRAKEYNSLTQGRPLSPSTQRYYEEHFGQGNVDYPAAQLYANGGNWQQEAFTGYMLEHSLSEPHHMTGQL